MSTGQSYVGGDSHAKHLEGTVKSRPDNSSNLSPDEVTAQFDASHKLPKANVTFDLSISTHSKFGVPQVETLLFALSAFRNSSLEDFAKHIRNGDVTDAEMFLSNVENCSDLIFDVALGAVRQAEINCWKVEHLSSGDIAYKRGVLRDDAQRQERLENISQEWTGRPLSDNQ